MELNINLSDENVYAVVKGTAENGEMFQKKVTPKQLLDVLTKSFPDMDDFATGTYSLVNRIPSKCTTYEEIEGLYMASKSQNESKRAIFYLPAARRVMYYETTENPYVFEFPSLIFYMETKKTKVDTSSMRIFAVKEKTLEEIGSDTVLYHYPFGNVYSEGKICWGGTSMPEIEMMSDFKKIILTFFGSVTNDDLFKHTKRVKKDIVCQRELFEFLVQADCFPNEILVSTKRTLAEL